MNAPSRSRRAFVIGHPIAHSRSPLIHGHWLAELGLAGSYERIDVAPDDLPAFMAALPRSGFAGGNVTVPHKEAAFGLVDDATPKARRLGAVNTLVVGDDGRVLGHNTDGAGFLASLDEAVGPGWAEEARRAVVIGAGGAGRAIAAAMLDRGLRVTVVNRSVGRAEAVRGFDPDRVDAVALDRAGEALRGAGLLVNTTVLGMAGQPPLEPDLAGLAERAIVADIVYVPAVTPLLAAARARGLRAVGGLGMLLHQAVPGFELWFGPRPTVTPELRRLIEADVARLR